MPHGSRKKRLQPQKRLQVTDDDGWTHITTGGNARRTQRKAASSSSVSTPLLPAEAPRNLTLEALATQFAAHRARWEGSAAWNTVEGMLRARTRPGRDETINAIVCIGLGSPSGFLKGGWVDRRSVSLYQLAAVVCIRDFYGIYDMQGLYLVSIVHILTAKATIRDPQNPPALLAQDPVFNTLDKSLLASLDITVLDHPQAFNLDLVPQSTLLYCPGAERAHLELLLCRPDTKPALVVGGPLEDADSEVLTDFARSRTESLRIPRFEANEHAFWGARIYCT